MRRLRLLPVLAAALVAAGAGPAAADPYLDASDATALTELLAEATEVQGVCYGWTLRLSDSSGGPSGRDAGSDQGVGRPPSEVGCARYVELQAYVTWTSNSSDTEDSSSFSVHSEGVADPPTVADLRDVGVGEGDLKNDDGDVALYRAVAALPRLVADRGGAPSLELEPAAADPLTDAGPTGSLGPDWLREHRGMLVLGSILLGVAALLPVLFSYSDRQKRLLAARMAKPPPARHRPADPPDPDKGAS